MRKVQKWGQTTLNPQHPKSPTLDERGVLFYLLALTPIVDSLNGLITGGGNLEGLLSLGIVFRMCIIVFCAITLISKGVGFRALLVFTCAYLLVVISSLIHQSYETVPALSRILFPILCIEAYVAIEKDRTDEFDMPTRLLRVWALVFPICILIPFLMGVGYATYNEAGYKGFYVAQNDISFILSVLYVFALYDCIKNGLVRRVIPVLLVAICILLLGMKSSYAVLIGSTVIIVGIADTISPVQKILSFGFVLALMLFLIVANSHVSAIVNRWIYYFESQELIDFLTSTRFSRNGLAYTYVCDAIGNDNWFAFGAGFLYSEGLDPYGLVEMDFSDLFFQVGIVGLLFFVVYYLSFAIQAIVSKKSGVFVAIYLIAMMFAAMAGHVLTSALSGTVLSVICMGLYASRVDRGTRFTVRLI